VITHADIDGLSRLSTETWRLISLYLRVDKERIDEDYAIRLKNLLRDAADTLGDRFDHEQTEAILADLERIREFFQDSGDRYGRGVALFVGSRAGIWRVYEIPRDIESQISIGFEAQIAPLIRLLEQLDTFCTCIISRDRARIFQGVMAEISEIDDILDEVPGQHDQGGWAQARYERHIEEHVRVHFKRVADRLFQLWNERPYRFLILGGPEEVVQSFLDHLHPYVRDRYIGAIHLLMVANINEVREESNAVIAQWRRAETQRLIETLRDEALSGDRGVVGIDKTIMALQQGQVLTLLVDDLLHVPGAVCSRCHSVQPETNASATECVFCSGELVHVADVIPSITTMAFRQDAAVVYPKAPELQAQLRDLGQIGAVLRFNIPSEPVV
jgi:peptide chain release factor subunit 1